MRKKFISFLACLVLLVSAFSTAWGYTLPEKMQNQLAIGSGLKGTITVSSSGEFSHTPFLNAVSDAEYDLRGIASGHDLHYYLFQEADSRQVKIGELYRREGQYFFRSDLVQGKILELSGLSVYLDSLFPVKGENPTLSSALLRYLALPEDTKDKQWASMINKYQNSLEMWLHDFTVQADVVKQENGSSAFDFSYVIPFEDVKKKLLSLFSDFAADAELQTLLDTVMTEEQKALYLNGSLTYFYEQALNTLQIKDDVRLSRRVSAMGDVISSKMVFPLDAQLTGYDLLTIENRDGISLMLLEGGDKAWVLGLPSVDLLKDQEYETSVWLSRINNERPNADENQNFSVRADIQKTYKEYNDEEEKSHQQEQYSVHIAQDTTYLPDALKEVSLADWQDIDAAFDVHYSSKYSQNSATTLELSASVKQGDSAFDMTAKLKTASPWLFMPFDVTDPVVVSPDHPEVWDDYQKDWISNAASMIRHSQLTDSVDASGDQAVPSETAEPSADETSVPDESGAEADAAIEETDTGDSDE